MRTLKTLLCVILLTSIVGCLGVMVPEVDRLAMSARYSELETHLEGQAKNQPNVGTKELFFLCGTYYSLKEYNKLFPCLDRLQSNIDKGDRTANMADISAVPAVSRAAAYLDFGNYDGAVAQATKAYEIVQQRNLNPWMRSQALSVLALAKALRGERAQAEEYARLLGDIDKSGPLKTDILNGQARTYMALGDFQRSLAIIKEDEAGAEERSFVSALVFGIMSAQYDVFAFNQLPKAFILNKSLYETGQVKEAKAGYDQLLKNPQTKDNGDIYWLILFDRGKIAAAEGNLQEAIDFYQKAIEVIERQRSTINTETSKIGFTGNKQQVYHSLIGALLATGQEAKAFEYVERSKSRALVDLLASKKDFVAPKADQQQVAALLNELEVAETEAKALTPGGTGVRSGRDLQVKQRLKAIAPELAALVTVAPVAAKDIQTQLQPDEALLEFYYEGNDLYAFVVSRESVKGVKLDGAKLIDEIKQFRAALKQPQSQSYVTPSQKLYARLIKPIEPALHSKQLLIVAHGALHYLPFNALQSGNEYLIDRYSIRQLPSASVLQFLKGRQASPSAGVLALGNPDLGNPKYDLKCAQEEVTSIAKGFPQAKVLVRKDATKTAFKTLGPKFSYLHFATHGQFDPDKPLNSGLLLAKDAQNDGFLSLNELFSLRLNADLVTLSACETGLGKVSSGDDVVGLTRGFLYAGSSTIVASLWEVDDEATSYLMEQFYANLKKGNKREALRQAQLATKKKYEHPYYWAAFGLTGRI